MKKTAFSLSLLFSLLAGAAVGCDVKTKKVDNKQVLFTVDGTNIFADDLLGFDGKTEMSYDFLSTDEGVEAVYEAVFKALAQKNVEVTSAIQGAVEEKMDEWDEKIESYASSNGVTKSNARKTKLEELGFESEDELRQSYLVEELEEELVSVYEDNHMEPGATGTTTDKSSMLERYVENASPMIVKHILTNVSDSATIYNMANITSKEVDKFVNVMQRLALGKLSRNTFKNVAYEESDDGSSSKGGNLGIMDTYTSFVSEFKLGLYVAEIIENRDNANYDASNTLGAKEFTDDLFGANGVYANYSVNTVNVATIGSVLAYVYEDQAQDEQKAAGHAKSSEYDKDLYPRNVIYNHYLNFPGIQYLVVDFTNALENIKALLAEVYPHASEAEIAQKAAEVMSSTYYTELSKTDNQLVKEGYVVDENESKIVLVKSTYGFHFLSVTYSSLDKEIAEATKYFMYGGSAPTSGTYVKTEGYNFGYSTATVGQNARKTEIKDRVLNFVKGGFENIAVNEQLYQYEIFNYYYNLNNVVMQTNALSEALANHINLAKTLKANAINEARDDSWGSYIEQLQATQEARALFY